jgi:hypothetical protein
VKFVELNRRGYALLDVTRDQVQAEWYHVATITEQSDDEVLAATFLTRNGENHVVAASGPTEPPSSSAAPAPAAVELA